MNQLRANLRLFLCGFLIIGSALYGVLIAEDPRIAADVMLGYIAVVLTVFVVTELWKKPPSDGHKPHG